MAEATEIAESFKAAEGKLGELRQALDAPAKAARIGEIEARMAQAGFWNDQEKARALMDEMKTLRRIVEPLGKLERELRDGAELLELAEAEGDAGTLAELSASAESCLARLAELELQALLNGPYDYENAFFSIQTGAGGSDACEWTEMLLRMYTRHFEMRGWKTEEISLQPGEEAGIKSVDLRVSGEAVYGFLRSEIGVHRLVRISPFSGRRETSFAAVDVVPDFVQTSGIEIAESDLTIERIHATGKGGQHVNKTASAVRITHNPSGLVVFVQTERSQHRNKDLGIKLLKSKLLKQQEDERRAADQQRNAAKMENAWGSQIRNYVLAPYTLVKDARTGCETGDAHKVLDGHLDAFVDAYLRWAVES